MKTFISCMTVCVLLFSCKKDRDLNQGSPVTKAKKYPVNFNISDFQPQAAGASKGNGISDAPLKGRAKYFTYIAYNAHGTEVSRIKQDSSGFTFRITKDDPGSNHYPIHAPAFGCISDTLASGQYSIVILASKTEYSINYRSEEGFEYQFQNFADASFFYNRGLDSWSRADDTFFKKFKITITEKASQHKVSLDRIVGKAEINILDSKPGTVFNFLFDEDNEAFKFSNEEPFGGTNDLFNQGSLPKIPGKEKLSYSQFLINTSSPVDVIINVYENGFLSASKVIRDVRFYKNKRTILTGTIYSPTTAFNVNVNVEFDKDSVEVSF